MRPSAALDAHRLVVREVLARYKLANLRVYGAARHGLDREDTELTLLVDRLPGAGTHDLDLVSLQLDLERLLGVSVDLSTPDELSPRQQAQVLADAQPV